MVKEMEDKLSHVEVESLSVLCTFKAKDIKLGVPLGLAFGTFGADEQIPKKREGQIDFSIKIKKYFSPGAWQAFDIN